MWRQRRSLPAAATTAPISKYGDLRAGAYSDPSGYVPVYRVFRGNIKFPNNPNHRFTASLSVYNNAVAAGWDGEAVNFCVPEL